MRKRAHRCQRVHVVSPENNFTVLDRHDRNEAVLIGGVARDDTPIDLVLKDHNTTIGTRRPHRRRSCRSSVRHLQDRQAPFESRRTYKSLIPDHWCARGIFVLERLNGDLPSFRSDKRSPIERRPPLNRVYVSKYAAALRATLGWKNLTTRGRETRHCRRLRDVTPQRLVCALVEALGAWRVETVAEILSTFNAPAGLNTRYKAIYKRLTDAELPP